MKTGMMYFKLYEEEAYNYWHSILTEIDWNIIDEAKKM